MSPDRQRHPLSRFLVHHRAMLAMAMVLTFTTAGTAAAVSYLVLGSVNTAAATTTLRSAVDGAVLQLTNTNASDGVNARGLGITVPAGRAPIKVNAAAGKATNLDADKLDGLDSTELIRGGGLVYHNAVSLPHNAAPYEHVIDVFPEPYFVVYYICPADQDADGTLWFGNFGNTPLNVFVDNGTGNPEYRQLPEYNTTWYMPAAKGGEHFTIQVQGQSMVTLEINSVHRHLRITGDCHVQAMATVSRTR